MEDMALDASEVAISSADEGEDEVVSDDENEGQDNAAATKKYVTNSSFLKKFGTQHSISAEAALSRIADVDIKGGWETGKPYAPYNTVIPNTRLIVSSVFPMQLSRKSSP